MRSTANRRRLAALALRAGLIASLGTSAPAQARGAEDAAPPVVHVRMHDIAFVPQTLTVAAGTTIVWTNDDDMTHTVTSGIDHDDGAFVTSPNVAPGTTFRVTLRTPGTYRYFCKPHVYSPAMHATIVVTAAAP